MTNGSASTPDRDGVAAPPTLAEVARAAGVSIATASRVLNNSTRVSPEAYQRVCDAASGSATAATAPPGAARRRRCGRSRPSSTPRTGWCSPSRSSPGSSAPWRWSWPSTTCRCWSRTCPARSPRRSGVTCGRAASPGSSWCPITGRCRCPARWPRWACR
ncbi:LacI family DNA-binding transcriptional regulator [Catellatospora bangladeshensis]|uniref:LacI family DNA-binding transcriptional regulator n=1 Tax=Catellatospora bangladeshensis TaxID=310355 RepID=UPI00360CFACC